MQLADVCLFNIETAIRYQKPVTYKEISSSVSEKSKKNTQLPPCSSIWHVNYSYTKEEVEQLKQSSLSASSQSTKTASLTPILRQHHQLANSDTQHSTHVSFTTTKVILHKNSQPDDALFTKTFPNSPFQKTRHLLPLPI
ncbi:hypothetical protein DSO57_1016888 [Entomophthora muscae]|uniref:Uncharacterized protein n=1 Tax=Entomophthora muscae TaxID=34485 RepID=A0ACC2SHT5_9FUNG|nr:hypothetical protein DSO57_1016888 [Entomophthora muscae]